MAVEKRSYFYQLLTISLEYIGVCVNIACFQTFCLNFFFLEAMFSSVIGARKLKNTVFISANVVGKNVM